MTRSRLAWIIPLTILLAVACWFLASEINFPSVQAWLIGLPPLVFFLLLVLLPLTGFPVTLLYVAVGLRFGFEAGLALTGFSILLNLLATDWLAAGFLRPHLRRWSESRGRHLPEVPAGEHFSIALLTALLPGPHAVKNYLALLSGLQLRPFLLVAVPIYTVRASSGILFGGAAAHVTTARVAFLAAYWLLVAVVCGVVLRRLQRRLRSVPAELTAV